jgi:hypothetical protein
MSFDDNQDTKITLPEQDRPNPKFLPACIMLSLGIGVLYFAIYCVYS